MTLDLSEETIKSIIRTLTKNLLYYISNTKEADKQETLNVNTGRMQANAAYDFLQACWFSGYNAAELAILACTIKDLCVLQNIKITEQQQTQLCKIKEQTNAVT